jgi:hypothetical protein
MDSPVPIVADLIAVLDLMRLALAFVESVHVG